MSETERGGPGRPEAARETGPRASVGPWLHGLVAVGLAGLFLLAVRTVLSPFILFILLLYLLWPLVGGQAYRRLAVATTVLFLLWVVDTTGLLLAPFILALILAYILDPAVTLLERRRVPRWAAVALLAVPLLAVLSLVVFVLAPAVARQVTEFISDVPSHLSAVERWLDGARSWVIRLGIPGIDESTVPRLRDIDAEAIVQYLQARRTALAQGGVQAVLGIGRGLGAALTLVAYLVLLPILTFYLLRDWRKVIARVTELIPLEERERVVGFVSRYDDLLSRYLRGQLLLATIVGLLIWLLFTIVDFPYALLLGLIAAVFNLVPYLGFAVTLVVSVLIALFSGAILPSLGKVAIVLLIEQVVEQVLGPLIVGESVGLHPVWVILALALFSFFFGFVGLLLAVPAAVLLKLVVEAWIQGYRGSAFYHGTVESGALEQDAAG
ncbi:MAG: AI-2E family transporter [Gemmatimonadota bacterium]